MEREREEGGGGERERERDGEGLSAVAGLDAKGLRSQPTTTPT